MNQKESRQLDQFRAAVIMTVVWVAGLTLGIIFIALFTGLLLDRLLNTKPLFTVVLVIVSIPVTIYATYRIVKKETGRIQLADKKEVVEEEQHRGKES